MSRPRYSSGQSPSTLMSQTISKNTSVLGANTLPYFPFFNFSSSAATHKQQKRKRSGKYERTDTKRKGRKEAAARVLQVEVKKLTEKQPRR